MLLKRPLPKVTTSSFCPERRSALCFRHKNKSLSFSSWQVYERGRHSLQSSRASSSLPFPCRCSLIPPLQDMKCTVITVSSHGLPELVHQLGRSQHTRYLQGDVSTFKTSSTVRLPGNCAVRFYIHRLTGWIVSCPLCNQVTHSEAWAQLCPHPL